ncbi:6789_t:CDS:1, partial [Cetraspora pellucida]
NYEDDINNHITSVETFFNRILNNIKNSQQLLNGIEHFIKRYEKSESISVGKLAAYLFQQNSTSKNKSIRSGSKIKVQPSSVQRRKSHTTKKNTDPYSIRARKKRTAPKKAHKLSKNVLANKIN